SAASDVYKRQSSDIEIYSKEIIRMRDSLYQIIAKHTGKDVEQIKLDADRDKYMSSRDAVEYGIIDSILETIPDSPNTKPEESK
ncbi:MAG: ATP-dependent Clp protease proteolytic subunit, partial [Candidatus Kapabacteria bacterium]|nr:ATP-dependent Clp protease proteolytic subunit [Candidatus Kapabacteria bacterium]